MTECHRAVSFSLILTEPLPEIIRCPLARILSLSGILQIVQTATGHSSRPPPLPPARDNWSIIHLETRPAASGENEAGFPQRIAAPRPQNVIVAVLSSHDVCARHLPRPVLRDAPLESQPGRMGGHAAVLGREQDLQVNLSLSFSLSWKSR